MNRLTDTDQLDLGGLNTELPDGGCITVAAGSGLDVILAAFGASPMSVGTGATDAWEAYVYTTGLGGVVVVEVGGGFQGARAEVIREASGQGRLGSIQWTTDLDSDLTLAERGQILYNDDVLAVEPGTDLPETVAPHLGDMPLGDNWLPGALQAIASFTGAFNVADPRLALVGRFRIDPIAGDVTTQEPATPSQPELDGELTLDGVAGYSDEWLVAFVCMGEARVIEMVRAARRVPELCRRLATLCARSALTEVNVLEHPVVVGPLASLEEGSPPRDLDELDRLIRRAMDCARRGDVPDELVPLKILRAASHPDPVHAGLDAAFLSLDWIESVGGDAMEFYALAMSVLKTG